MLWWEHACKSCPELPTRVIIGVRQWFSFYFINTKACKFWVCQTFIRVVHFPIVIGTVFVKNDRPTNWLICENRVSPFGNYRNRNQNCNRQQDRSKAKNKTKHCLKVLVQSGTRTSRSITTNNQQQLIHSQRTCFYFTSPKTSSPPFFLAEI